MNKFFLLLALVLAALLAAVGLQPKVLGEGPSTALYEEEIKTGKGYANKATTAVMGAMPASFHEYLKGDGPDENLQTGELTEAEKAELEAMKNGKGKTDPDDKTTSGKTDEPEEGTNGKDGDDKTASKTPEKGTGDDTPKENGVDTKEPGDTKTPTTAPTGKVTTLVLTEDSEVDFAGYSKLKTQTCWFNFIDGKLDLNDGSPEGGVLEVELNTMEIDCKDGGFTKVCKEYFLEAPKFDTATFKSRSIKKDGEKYRVVGDLTIKDNTETFGFGAEIDHDDESFTLTAEVRLDRQKYGLGFNGAGNYAISDEFSINLNLVGETE